MKLQHGQSMTEFAVGAATLSLLLLGALVLAGYIEVDRRVVIAAREQAWQAALPSATADARTLAHNVHRHALADSGVRDPTGRRQLVQEDGVVVESTRRQLNGAAGSAHQFLLTPLRITTGFLGPQFDLADPGLFQGTIRVAVEGIAGMPKPFDGLELQLQSGYSLLGDAWHAGGVRHVQERTEGLVPVGALRALGAIWQPLSVPLGVVEPSLRQLCFGLIEADRVPEDRLGPGRTPLAGACP